MRCARHRRVRAASCSRTPRISPTTQAARTPIDALLVQRGAEGGSISVYVQCGKRPSSGSRSRGAPSSGGRVRDRGPPRGRRPSRSRHPVMAAGCRLPAALDRQNRELTVGITSERSSTATRSHTAGDVPESISCISRSACEASMARRPESKTSASATIGNTPTSTRSCWSVPRREHHSTQSATAHERGEESRPRCSSSAIRMPKHDRERERQLDFKERRQRPFPSRERHQAPRGRAGERTSVCGRPGRAPREQHEEDGASRCPDTEASATCTRSAPRRARAS